MKKLKLHEEEEEEEERYIYELMNYKRKNSLDLNPNPLARNSSIYHE